MKLSKLSAIMVVCATAFALHSCSDTDDPIEITRHWATLGELRMDNAGVWADYLNPAITSVSTGTVNFSHSVKDGVWYGFVPVDLDVVAHSADKAPEQWVCANYDLYLNRGNRYLVAHWNPDEEYTFPSNCTSCVITCNDGREFVPYSITINNTLEAYNAMKNGVKGESETLLPYGENDECKIVFYGIRNDVKTEETFVYIATKGKILDGFIEVPLCNVLGVVDKVVVKILVTPENPDKKLYIPHNFCAGDYSWISEEDYNKFGFSAK